jgi:hypothetical protein
VKARLANEQAQVLVPAMNRAYRIALFCGACPLVVGVSVFLLWMAFHWDWLMDAGIWTIVGGILLFMVGAISLIVSHQGEMKAAKITCGKVWRSTLLCAGLLLSNFLVARVIVGVVDDILGITKNHGVLAPDEFGQIKLSDWRITKNQALGFGIPRPKPKNESKALNVIVHIQGHIEGSAIIQGSDGTFGSLNSFSSEISGDVNLHISSECSSYSSNVIIRYKPTDVTKGQLTFRAEFQ